MGQSSGRLGMCGWCRSEFFRLFALSSLMLLALSCTRAVSGGATLHVKKKASPQAPSGGLEKDETESENRNPSLQRELVDAGIARSGLSESAALSVATALEEFDRSGSEEMQSASLLTALREALVG